MCFEKVHFKDQAKSNSIETLKLETGADTSFGSVSRLRDLLRPEDVHRLNNNCQVPGLLSMGGLLTTVYALLNISSKAPLNAKLKKNKEKKHCSLLPSLHPENSLVSEGQSSLIQIPTVYCEAFFASSESVLSLNAYHSQLEIKVEYFGIARIIYSSKNLRDVCIPPYN